MKMRMATTTAQHKQGKSKPYNKGFNAGAEYAFSEHNTLTIYLLQQLWHTCERDDASDAILIHINALQDKLGALTFPPFLGEAPDNR
jgi:hypothetical protein